MIGSWLWWVSILWGLCWWVNTAQSWWRRSHWWEMRETQKNQQDAYWSVQSHFHLQAQAQSEMMRGGESKAERYCQEKYWSGSVRSGVSDGYDMMGGVRCHSTWWLYYIATTCRSRQQRSPCQFSSGWRNTRLMAKSIGSTSTTLLNGKARDTTQSRWSTWRQLRIRSRISRLHTYNTVSISWCMDQRERLTDQTIQQQSGNFLMMHLCTTGSCLMTMRTILGHTMSTPQCFRNESMRWESHCTTLRQKIQIQRSQRLFLSCNCGQHWYSDIVFIFWNNSMSTRGLKQWQTITKGLLIDSEIFAKEFEDFRIRFGLGLSEACKKIGLNSRTVKRAIDGKRVMPDTIEKLKDAGFTVRSPRD